MGTISVSLPSDGQTIDAADYNVPINTIVTEINGGLDSDNIEAGGVVPNNLASGTGTSWAWQSYVPTWTNLTVSGSTLNYAKYIQIGKTVHLRIKLTLGGGNVPSGTVGVSPPVNLNTDYAAGDALNSVVHLIDTGTENYKGIAKVGAATRIDLYNLGSSGTFLTTSTVVNATQPHTWANTDILIIYVTYEAP